MSIVYEPNRCQLLRTASHYVTWFLGSHFPGVIPLVFITGYPKSGTTWVCQITADYLQLPFPRFSILPVGCPAVVHGHQRVSRRFPLGIYVLRDGRDALVSKYFHFVRSMGIPVGDNPRLSRKQRAMFPVMRNRDDARSNIAAFIERQLTRPTAAPCNWAEHVRSYFETANPNMVLLKYEDLKRDDESVFAKAMTMLAGEEADPQRIRATLEKYSFARQAGRKAGHEDRKSFLRKGQAGDWRNHFTREAAEIFDRYCGEMLIRAGYETSGDWVASVSA